MQRRLQELAWTPAEVARLARWAVPPETVERMPRRGAKSFISEGMAEFLARALAVPESRVRRAAGLPPVADPRADVATKPHLRLIRDDDKAQASCPKARFGPVQRGGAEPVWVRHQGLEPRTGSMVMSGWTLG